MSKPPETLGPLHELLIRGLPDYVVAGTLDVKGKLAPHFAISYQAVYKWFERNRVSARRMHDLIKMSEISSNQPKKMVVGGEEVPWAPLNIKDFEPFI